MTHDEILHWLHESDATALQTLWHQADTVRHDHVGDEVHLRGLVEVSNYCSCHCNYCGIRADNSDLQRYRLSDDEVLDCARQIVKLGYGTIVMQAGEDPTLSGDAVTDIIKAIRTETDLAITLSLGQRPVSELEAWREAGANRYLVRFETSNPTLYRQHHPAPAPDLSERLGMLETLRSLDYEVGSGVMIGLPGQTCDDLANDISRFQELDLDMVGVGPFIPHPQTPAATMPTTTCDQVPADELMTYKTIALTRLVCPNANIPSTTALSTLNPTDGHELGLQRGANVVMPNITPTGYRAQYEIYPDKSCIKEPTDEFDSCLRKRIASIGRTIGVGRGDSPNLINKSRRELLVVERRQN